MNDDQWDWLILGGGLTILVAFLVVLAIFSRGAMP
jgi:hypothetical protein